ncbi:membrane hypothetical protein [Candidatus Desulfarcum epimagneticum]|uniref:Uncharacterized protein n=1 Tax=uncultured Desulfobacteraceae bacterium TaxID=218296 RepID=A0A484HLM9_9BACT|nr:membrane hypothetical protein [uncultured Desulfobacteraceae bacterium]
MGNRSFEEYRLITESVQFLTERRQHASQIYTSINVAVFSVILFIAKDLQGKGWIAFAGVFFICILGILICLAWRTIIQKYAHLIDWKYRQLRTIEARRDMEWSHKICSREWKEIYETNWDNGKKSFSNIEKQMPGVLIWLYGAGCLAVPFFLIAGFF